MNLVADEGVDRAVIEGLRRDGHDVVYVAELSPGIQDEQVLQQANALSAPLITSDRDFGDLVFRQQLVHSGVVLIRLAGLSHAAKASIVSAVFREHVDQIVGAFTVISRGQVRIRARS